MSGSFPLRASENKVQQNENGFNEVKRENFRKCSKSCKVFKTVGSDYKSDDMHQKNMKAKVELELHEWPLRRLVNIFPKCNVSYPKLCNSPLPQRYFLKLAQSKQSVSNGTRVDKTGLRQTWYF
ncbi:hypothetical protein CEXT_22691 [Caerostris extrusa]|uniref:Uncharacterized protein n=1 Tax=Caerostris extrusa TaxID=172846 RepID=A0AAV4MGH2_CAEEX|nr:hypothetical protein CEXT_22691 [Caerostris extrusa]